MSSDRIKTFIQRVFPLSSPIIPLQDRNTMAEKIIWERTGDQGDAWEKAEVTVTSPDPTTPIQVMFRAVRGTSLVSDVAIDLVQGLSGSCEQYAKTPSG